MDRTKKKIKTTNKSSPLTFQRISTDVVVCGVTERILGASSGAEGEREREEEKMGLNRPENVQRSKMLNVARVRWHSRGVKTHNGLGTEQLLTDESKKQKKKQQ